MDSKELISFHLKNLYYVVQIAWQNLFGGKVSEKIPPLPSRLLTEEDLKSFYEVMIDAPTSSVLPDAGMKRKGGYLGGLDTQHYGRGKRAREVNLYEFCSIILYCVYHEIYLTSSKEY